ncbi:hypothetical protein Tco_1186785, partial [Tanacetum coccineum]
WVSDDEPEAPEAAPQSPRQAPPSPVYMPSPEHPPSLDYDQPLPMDASPTTLSSGYIADSESEVDSKEDSEEDHADYPTDEGDDDDGSFDDDSDDNDDDTVDEEEEQEALDNDDAEEEHLASTDSSVAPIDDHARIAEYVVVPTVDSPTYVEAPLGYKAAEIRLRPTSPSPPLLLRAPSTSHRADIPEVDMPPRKRLLLTAPTPRFKVGESPAAAR